MNKRPKCLTDACEVNGGRNGLCPICRYIDDLKTQIEKVQAVASQINTDWIPANKQLAARIAELDLNVLVASATAHRACTGTEHDPQKGKLHGYCVVCGVGWPCETAKTFLHKAKGKRP